MATKTELVNHLGTNIRQHPLFHRRAALWHVQERDGGDFIGLYYDSDIIRDLEARDPLHALSSANIDAFCVLIEEVSHLHLVLNRASADREVNHMELELQAEIDKIIICSHVLAMQTGDPHLMPLSRQIFDAAEIAADLPQLYWTASKLAARFWYSMLREGQNSPETCQLIRPRMRQFYRGDLDRKCALLDHPLPRIAA